MLMDLGARDRSMGRVRVAHPAATATPIQKSVDSSSSSAKRSDRFASSSTSPVLAVASANIQRRWPPVWWHSSHSRRAALCLSAS